MCFRVMSMKAFVHTLNKSHSQLRQQRRRRRRRAEGGSRQRGGSSRGSSRGAQVRTPHWLIDWLIG